MSSSHEMSARGTMYGYADGVVGQASDVTVEDVSITGIRIIHNRPIFAGEQFLLSTPIGGRLPVTFVCVARTCRSIKPGTFLVAAQLVRVWIEPVGQVA